MQIEKENWSLVIKPQSKWLDLRLKEIWSYRDLILIFVRRDIVAIYKQTVLGPLWFFLAPIFTVIAYTFVFGSIAGMSTDGIPAPVFYLGGTTLWGYFQTSFTQTSNTFTNNAAIFGKVYFPRMVAPISIVLSSLFKFGVQMLMFLAVLGYYMVFTDAPIHFTNWVLCISSASFNDGRTISWCRNYSFCDDNQIPRLEEFCRIWSNTSHVR